MRVNHAVIKVRELGRSCAFYERVLGLELIARAGARMAFLRAPQSTNHHDLGLLAIGRDAPAAPEGTPGLFHLAWEVERIEELPAVRERLRAEGALTGASDHGATKSIYGVDPDGNELEVMWLAPHDAWGDFDNAAPTMPLDLEAEVARWAKAPVTAPPRLREPLCRPSRARILVRITHGSGELARIPTSRRLQQSRETRALRGLVPGRAAECDSSCA